MPESVAKKEEIFDSTREHEGKSFGDISEEKSLEDRHKKLGIGESVGSAGSAHITTDDESDSDRSCV